MNEEINFQYVWADANVDSESNASILGTFKMLGLSNLKGAKDMATLESIINGVNTEEKEKAVIISSSKFVKDIVDSKILTKKSTYEKLIAFVGGPSSEKYLKPY